MSRINRAYLVFCSVLVTAILAPGCSLKVSSDLNAKGDQPLSDCISDADCTGLNQGCVEQTDGNSVWDQCTCAVGYSADPGTGDCTVWNGLIQAPGFDDATPWTRVGDVAILPMDPGKDDTGIAQFKQAGLCDLARVSQTIDTSSSLAAMGPMVIQVTARIGLGTGAGPYIPMGYQASMGVGINGHWSTFFAPDDWKTTRICLGESDLGGPVEVSVGTMAQLDAPVLLDCNSPTFFEQWAVEVTRAELLPADPNECPAVGEIENPHFETSSGWQIVDQTGSAGATLTPGVGKDSSQGMLFTVPMNTGFVAATVPYLWPADPTDAQAISFWVKGNNGAQLQVRSGSYVLDTITTNGGQQDVTICVPTYLNGTGQDITFGTPLPMFTTTWPAGTNIVVDDVSGHAEPDCGDTAFVLNGSFEYASYVPTLLPQVPNYANNTVTAAAVMDPLDARTGQMSFAISSGNRSQGLFAGNTSTPTFWAGSHLGDASGGPAVAFWYLAENVPDFRLRTTLDGSNQWLTQAPGWHRHFVCLPKNAQGRPVSFRYVFEPLINVNTAVPTETIFVDDVIVTNEPSCM